MKKSFLFLLSGFLVSGLCAQHTQFGLKGGLNISSIETTGSDYNAKVGVHFGGLAHIHVSRHFAVQPELVFSTQGGKVDDVERLFNYINIPVLAQYMVNDGFRLQTGPQLGLLASARYKRGNTSVDVKDEFAVADFSWVFGLGYLFPEGFGVDGRFNLGLSNINDNSAFKVKHRVFQLGFFYQFKQVAKNRKK